MAVLAAAQLLDELMGRHRNTNPNDKIRKPNWEDPEYCKYYMVKFCPHDLFVNTRADLGVCPKVHDDEVKDLFEKAESSYKKSQYVEEYLRFCRHMINDVERKIQKGKQRLDLMNSKPEGPPMTQAQTEKNQEQVQLLSEKITNLMQEAEETGTRGDVEQAQGLMKLCDRLKEEKEQLLKQQENSHWSMTAELAAAQEKQMEVCPVCGAFLIVGDAQQRIDDHLSGKQHVGPGTAVLGKPMEVRLLVHGDPDMTAMYYHLFNKHIEVSSTSKRNISSKLVNDCRTLEANTGVNGVFTVPDGPLTTVCPASYLNYWAIWNAELAKGIKDGTIRSTDAQQRIDDHLSGKLHLGYFKLRQAYEEMSESREKEQQEKERKRREEREKERNSRGGGGLGSDRRDRERMERDRERDRGGRDKDKDSKEKDSKEKDSKERDTKERDTKDKDSKEKDSKDKDRHRSSRDDKDRGKDRERERDKERERDRERRSHRKDRRSSRDRSRRRSRERH